MGMNVTMSADAGVLYVYAWGTFSLEAAKRTFIEMMEEVARQQARKVFFDGRQLKGQPTPIERFFYGEFIASAVKTYGDREVSPMTQFAYLLEVPVLDRQRFGENVASSRGMYVRTFDNLERAVAWLGVAPPKPRSEP